MANRVYQIRHGDVWFGESSSENRLLSTDRHVCDGSDHLAIAWQEDDDFGLMIMKHGSSEMVTKWADEQRSKLASAGFDGMASGLSVVSFPVHEDAVAVLNRVVAGQSHDFLKRLEALQGSVPATLPYPR